jgi:SAM-dependent methyltransferase
MSHAVDIEIVRFAGFDSAGEAFLHNEQIYRGIYPGKGALIRGVLDKCHENNLFDCGVVATQISMHDPLPELGYEVILEHEKIPFISYPYEWSSAMLQQAALFHIDLYDQLAPNDLVIKDWHPQNILFNGTKPVFVDFTSIVPFENLYEESYLTPPHIPRMFKTRWDVAAAYLWEMHLTMFAPYFLLPLYLMQKGQHTKARQRILETAINTSRSAIRPREVFPMVSLGHLQYRKNNFNKKIALIEPGERKKRFWEITRREVEDLNVVVKSSDYYSYYEEKGENFDYEYSPQWTEKQKVVYESILKYQPATVLDVASNTGWFSVLAAKNGSKVVAFDVDEACVNSLYLDALGENLPILPLVLDFTRLTGDIFPVQYPDEESHTRIGGEFPLLISADRRLKCEMVLALGFIHHLVLGHDQDILHIINTLSKLCAGHLLLEFIAKDDHLISSELDFFPALNNDPHRFEWYNLKFITDIMRKHFSDVLVKDSYPDTRKIIFGVK